MGAGAAEGPAALLRIDLRQSLEDNRGMRKTPFAGRMLLAVALAAGLSAFSASSAAMAASVTSASYDANTSTLSVSWSLASGDRAISLYVSNSPQLRSDG